MASEVSRKPAAARSTGRRAATKRPTHRTTQQSARRTKQTVPPAEWQVRVELAACYRLVHMEGWADMVSTHISARVPGEEDHFLLNPHGMLFDEITASSLIKVDVNGNQIDASSTGHGISRAGFVIHSAVHMSRQDGKFVLHTHTPACVAVGSQKSGLQPWTQHAMAIIGDVAYHGFEGAALRLDERERIVADLGSKRILFLRNHGLLTVGASAADAFMASYRAERACRMQLAMLQAGPAIVPLPPSVQQWSLEHASHAYFPGGRLDPNRLEWPALIRRLDRIDPSYQK
jgi:ribulose-5-phosphate 4-epimerase/fuculose-1-phosphate aldolase